MGVCREKYFEEKTADEKADKLAESLEYLVREVKSLRNEVSALRHHTHSKNGDVTIPLVNALDGNDSYPSSYFYRNPVGREHKRLD